MYVPWGNITNHNTIPVVGLKPLQSSIKSVIIDGRWLIGTIGRIMARLWNFTFKANKLWTVESMVFVWITDGTKDEGERCNGWCNDVGQRDKALNGTVAIVSPWIEGYLWVISVATESGHRWVCGGIFFTTFNNIWNIWWRNWGGQSFIERTRLKNERFGKHTLAFDNSNIFFL